MKKSASSVLLAILVTVVLVGAPLAYFFNAERLKASDLALENAQMTEQLASLEAAAKASAGEMLFYDLNGVDATASSKEVAFTDLFTAENLNARAADCSETVEANHFEDLVAKFADVKGMQYSFTSNTDAEEVFTATVFPNAAEYKDLAAFVGDYNACSIGGTSAVRMNEKKILFYSPCGSGYAEAPTLSCSDIKSKVEVEFN